VGVEAVDAQEVVPGDKFRARLGLLTQEELAAVLDVSPDTLREWRRLKQGPDYVKAGKGVMYREKDIMRWLERNIVPVGYPVR
jgi:hypothetical protein